MKNRLAGLESQKADMDLLQMDYDAAEKVLHQIQPKRDLLKHTRGLLVKTTGDIKELQALLTQQEETVRQAQAAVDGDSSSKEKIQNLIIEIQNLRNTLPIYEKLDARQKEKNAAEMQAQKAGKQKDGAKNQFERIQAELEGLAQEQSGLAGIDAKVVELTNSYKEAQKNTMLLTGTSGIQARVKSVCYKERQLSEQIQTLKRLAREACGLEQIHHDLYQAFISGQAGILAEELRQGLAAHGTAECPVCHSKFHAGQDHSFAVLTGQTPPKSKVDAAKLDYEKKEQARKKQDAAVTALRAAAGAEKDGILREAQALLTDCPDWDTLVSNGYLDRQIERFQRTEADARRALDNAVSKQRRNAELEKLQEQGKTRLNELEKTISAWDEESRKQELAAGKLNAAINELQKQLKDYPDRKAAEEQIRTKINEQAYLQKQVDGHQKTLEKANEKRITMNGSLTSMQNRVPELERDQKEAEDALNNALSQNGFSTLEDADRALVPVGGRDGEIWLREQRTRLENYRRSLGSVKERLETLAEKTAGLTYTDLTELETQIKQADAALTDANTVCSRQEQLLENHRITAKKVSKAKAKLEKSEPAWQRLNLLADLAVGTSGEGGKLSFDRYVMGTCLLSPSPSPRDLSTCRMPSSA